MPLSVVIVLCVVALFLFGALRFRALLRRMITQAHEELAQGRDESPLLQGGGYLIGTESTGALRGRANGLLRLDADLLRFRLFAAPQVFELPTTAITKVERREEFLERKPGREMLVLRFRGADGPPDAIGFLVTDPALWQEAVERARAAATPPRTPAGRRSSTPRS